MSTNRIENALEQIQKRRTGERAVEALEGIWRNMPSETLEYLPANVAGISESLWSEQKVNRGYVVRKSTSIGESAHRLVEYLDREDIGKSLRSIAKSLATIAKAVSAKN